MRWDGIPDCYRILMAGPATRLHGPHEPRSPLGLSRSMSRLAASGSHDLAEGGREAASQLSKSCLLARSEKWQQHSQSESHAQLLSSHHSGSPSPLPGRGLGRGLQQVTILLTILGVNKMI